MSRYIRERYKGFQSYTPGEQPKEMEYIKLNTNESPFPPAPGVCRRLKEADMERLRLYPDISYSFYEVIAKLHGVNFRVNTLSLILGSAVMEDEAYYRKNAEIIQENRKYTAETLTFMGFEVLPSKANFVFARRPGMDGDMLYRKLKEKGVLVRHFTTERIQDYVRITIGTKEQMDVLFAKLREILQEE